MPSAKYSCSGSPLKMSAGFGRGDAVVFATLAHAAFQDTAHAELPTDLLVRVARPV
jgi:hypothetical protein